MICGMTRGTTSAHVARAVVESIAYQVRDVFDAMQEESGVTLRALLADGGATRNDQLMQFQADVLDCAVMRNSSPEVSPLGAAFWRARRGVLEEPGGGSPPCRGNLIVSNLECQNPGAPSCTGGWRGSGGASHS